MGKKGIHGVILALAFLFIVIFSLQIADEADASSKPTIVGTQVPFLGPWYISEDTYMYDGELNISKSVYVMRGVEVTFENVTLNIRLSEPDNYHEFVFKVEAGTTVIVKDSTLHLDTFIAVSQASLNFEQDSIIRTKGRFYGSCNSFFAEDTTFLNIAPGGEADQAGEDANFIADGKVNSEFSNVRIVNRAGNAGKTSPGVDGKPGGMSVFISNITAWIDCSIECTAGISAPGGLGLTGDSGGSGGIGGDVEIHINTPYLENVVINGNATDGGNGARGAENPGGNAGDGGDGADGGNVLISIDSTGVLELYNVNILAISGTGGSGGNGGEATNGDGGVAGIGANAGFATIEVQCMDDIYLEDSAIIALGGEGGYGGGYGRHLAGNGTFGIPRPGGDGGKAFIGFDGKTNLLMSDIEVLARGGAGMDGGAGYQQGETGGAGSDGVIRFTMEGNIEATDVKLEAFGGNGGHGGISFSEILGNGGDGGDSVIEHSGLLEMNLERLYISCVIGVGGKGNSAMWDGSDGIATFDLDTQYLTMREGELNQPLDDLHDNAEGHLYNVTFDLTGVLPVLPIGNAHIWTYFPVTVVVTDNQDPTKAKRLEGYNVTVISVRTGAVVAEGVTDERGECRFELVAFHYTLLSVIYEGSYHFYVTSPDGEKRRIVRGEIQGPTTIGINLEDPWMPLVVTITEPMDGSNLILDKVSSVLESYGYITCDDTNSVTSVFVQIYPVIEGPSTWPVYELVLSTAPLSELEDPDEKWGILFPPEEYSNRWQWFVKIETMGGDVDYLDGQYVLLVTAGDGFHTRSETIHLWMDIEEVHNLPLLELTSPVNGTVWNGPNVEVSGLSSSDYGIARIELSFDNESWTNIVGQENWTYLMSTDVLGEGNHTVQVRAFDGEFYSSIVERWFIVDTNGNEENNGEEGGLSFTDTALFGLAILLLAIGVFGFVALRLRKSRPPSGENQGW